MDETTFGSLTFLKFARLIISMLSLDTKTAEMLKKGRLQKVRRWILVTSLINICFTNKLAVKCKINRSVILSNKLLCQPSRVNIINFSFSSKHPKPILTPQDRVANTLRVLLFYTFDMIYHIKIRMVKVYSSI